jgi:hypothetical protein
MSVSRRIGVFPGGAAILMVARKAMAATDIVIRRMKKLQDLSLKVP